MKPSTNPQTAPVMLPTKLGFVTAVKRREHRDHGNAPIEQAGPEPQQKHAERPGDSHREAEADNAERGLLHCSNLVFPSAMRV